MGRRKVAGVILPSAFRKFLDHNDEQDIFQIAGIAISINNMR
jgi:hypothetical protein